MKKTLPLLAFLLLAMAGAAFAAPATVAVLTKPGARSLTPAVDAAQVVAVEALGGLPVSGTVTVSRVTHNCAATNQVAELTLSSGAAAANITNGLWLIRGDTLLWSGTATSGVVRVYLKQ